MEDVKEVQATVYRRLPTGSCFAQTGRGESIFIAPRLSDLAGAQPGDTLVLGVRANPPERFLSTPYAAVYIADPKPEAVVVPEPETPAPEPAQPAVERTFRERIEDLILDPRNEARVWTGPLVYEALTGEKFSYKQFSGDTDRMYRINQCYTALLQLSKDGQLYCCRIGYNERRASYMSFGRSLSRLLPCGQDADEV